MCLHPGSCSLTSGAAQWESADSSNQPAGVTYQLRRPRTEKNTFLSRDFTYQLRRTGQLLSPNTWPHLPAFRRMSAGAPRCLASSGQKPIAEILHPLSAAEEQLSVSVAVGGDTVGSAGAVLRPVWYRPWRWREEDASPHDTANYTRWHQPVFSLVPVLVAKLIS